MHENYVAKQVLVELCLIKKIILLPIIYQIDSLKTLASTRVLLRQCTAKTVKQEESSIK